MKKILLTVLVIGSMVIPLMVFPPVAGVCLSFLVVLCWLLRVLYLIGLV